MNVKKTNTLDECDSAPGNRSNAKFSELVSDFRALGRRNIQAVAESGRLLQGALGKLAGESLASGQIGIETMVADCKNLAAARSFSQLVQWQAKVIERNLDQYFAHAPSLAHGAIATGSRIAAPLHRQMKANMRSLPAMT